jgi:hypothetical protein
MACKCDVGLSNTGTACTPLQAVARQYILTPKFKADGTLNKLDITSTLNSAFWTSQVNAVAEERWYPLPRVQNVTDEKGDNIVQSFNDGSTAFIAEGARTVVGFLPGQAPHLVGQINDARCSEIAMYVIDKDGNLIGKCIEDGFLHPICLEDETISATYVKNDASATVSGVNIAFTWSLDEKDENMSMITVDEMTDGVAGIKGLLDISSSYANISTTGFDVTLTVDGYGTKLTPQLVKGLVAGDFALFNVTDSLSVTILTATESPDGTYAITFAAQTSADVLRLTPTKDGYDFSNVVTNTITIP